MSVRHHSHPFNCATALLLVLVLVVQATPAVAQEGKAPSPDRGQELIQSLRGGEWKLNRVERLLRFLIAKRQTHAARAWMSWALVQAEAGNLPGKTKKALKLLAAQNGLKPVEPSLRALPARALKHLKKLSSSRYYDAMPGAIHLARQCLELYPNKKMKAQIDALEASLETVDRSMARPPGAGILKVTEKIRSALAQARDELLADMVEQYERYPCPPGARTIRSLILARGEAGVSAQWRAAWNRVADIEYRVEPKLKLKVWLENGGKVYVYRRGRRLQGLHGRSYLDERHQGVTFEVVAGDVLQFEVKKFYARKGPRKLFVAAAVAELEGKPLPPRAWAENTNRRGDSIDPLVNPFCRGVVFDEKNRPRGISDEVQEQMAALGSGILFKTANEFRHYAIDWHRKLIRVRESFAARRQNPTWLGGEGERFCLVLRIHR